MNATATILGISLVAAGTLFAITKMFESPTISANETTNPKGEFELLVDPQGAPVQFVLFTSNNTPYMLDPANDSNFDRSGFNPEYPTKIITHGFLSSITNNIFRLMKDAYATTGNYNIIGMDWSALCRTEYVSAMRGARTAGQKLGDFLNFLSSKDIDLDDVHLIGHSLGAHVAAIGAENVDGQRRIGRITGLDPAGPGYGDMRDELKLDPQDARLVDVVHTFMRVIGTTKPSGHVDFYPNGGRHQPGCPDLPSLQVTDIIYCNHGRSYELFAEAIRNPSSFQSKRCNTVDEALTSRCLEETQVYMGQEQTYEYGLYYFKTRSKSPFSMTVGTRNKTKTN